MNDAVKAMLSRPLRHEAEVLPLNEFERVVALTFAGSFYALSEELRACQTIDALNAAADRAEYFSVWLRHCAVAASNEREAKLIEIARAECNVVPPELAKAVAWFQSVRHTVDGPKQAWFENKAGERFVYETLASGGIKEEGHPWPASFATPREAVASWTTAIDAYARDKPGTVYWRVRPRMEVVDQGRFNVYSRLLITDATIELAP